jgi:hypothetical protein
MIPGKYKAQCKKTSFEESAGTKNKYVLVVFAVETDDGPSEIEWKGYFGPSEKVRDRTMESLEYMGWDKKSLADLGPLSLHVELEIFLDDYTGTPTPKVKWVNKLGGSVRPGRRLSDDEIIKFAGSMNRHINDDGIGW